MVLDFVKHICKLKFLPALLRRCNKIQSDDYVLIPSYK